MATYIFLAVFTLAAIATAVATVYLLALDKLPPESRNLSGLLAEAKRARRWIHRNRP